MNIFNDFEQLDFINLDWMMWEGEDVFTAQNASHSVVSSNIDLVVKADLVVHSAVHALTSDNAILQPILLTVASCVHGLSSDQVALVEHKTLAVASTAHTISDTADIIYNVFLEVDDITHALESENVVLKTLDFKIAISGEWKAVNTVNVLVAGEWKRISEAYFLSGGNWKAQQ